MADDLSSHILANPFAVLGLTLECSRKEFEREGQKLLGMLELSLDGAATYQTPAGPEERTAELVRWAMAELRDPDRRLFHELFFLQPDQKEAPLNLEAPEAWKEAFRSLGWGKCRSL